MFAVQGGDFLVSRNMLVSSPVLTRTYGGAVSLRSETSIEKESGNIALEPSENVLLVDKVDVLIATSVNPYYDSLLKLADLEERIAAHPEWGVATGADAFDPADLLKVVLEACRNCGDGDGLQTWSPPFLTLPCP
jgi:hypothetical protein